MKIDVLCTDGSPLGVSEKSIYGEDERIGVGGSEIFLLTLCRAWHDVGHEVVLYNSPKHPNHSAFEQRPRHAFDPNEDRDVLITFRTPNEKAIISKGKKVWLSCDQYTSRDFKPFAPYMDKIVLISDFHKEYFKSTYGITNTEVIDIPVRLDDLDVDVKREPKKCIFTSVPDRGLLDLHRFWTNTIIKKVPDATLTITSDYRLWGVDERNAPHRLKWMYEQNVRFLGAVKRRDLIREQLSAQLLVYPSTYDELFGVSVAEAQACGVYPITSDTGALPTTNMGTVIPRSTVNYPGAFSFKVVELLNDPNLKQKQDAVRKKAIERFSVDRILKEWDEKVFA